MRNFFKSNIWRRTFTTKGFTIFEMLVAIGLIALFSAMIVANYSNFRQTTNLKGESEKLTSLVRKAQLWALTGQTRGGVRPPGGWGVYIEQCTSPPCRFFLYADMSPISPPNHTYDAGSDEIVTEVFTQQHVQIAIVTPNVGDAVDLVFTPPASTGYINGAQIDNQASITFYQPNANRSQSVTINRKTNRISLAEVVDPPITPQCSDGWDNDSDGLIDFGQDPGCDDASDNSEFNSPLPVVIFEDRFFENSDRELGANSDGYNVEVGLGWIRPPLMSVINNNQNPGATLRADAGSRALEDHSSCGDNDGSFYQTIDVFSTPNYLVQAMFDNTGGADDFGMIAARIQANGDMYLFQWDTNRGQLFLRYNGAWLQLGDDIDEVSKRIAIGDEVRLMVYDNRINVSKFDGAATTLLINEVDNTLSAAGSAGVGLGAVVTHNAGCKNQRLDDFIVKTNITAPFPQCNDGIDNDGDGVIDFGSDGDCSSISDDLEYAALPRIIPEFYDDFNAIISDTVLDDDTPSGSGNYSTNVGPIIGSGWTQIVGGSFQNLRADVDNDYLEPGSCGWNEASLYRINDNDQPSSADYEVSVSYREISSSDDYSIIAARIQDANNMYAFQWSTTRGELWVKNGGSWSQLTGDPDGPNGGDEVTLKVEGNNISYLYNGVVVRSEFDPTHAGAGYAGVGMGSVITSGADCNNQKLDNFKVLVP